MKLAAAMKYGGELVAAEDCTYDSFKELVPLCPNCKEPVFLRIGSDRLSVKGKEFKVGPHWCHFKGVSAEQVAGCEARVSGYSDKDKQRIASQARGQRLKLLQRWFWKVVEKTAIDFSEGSTKEDFDKRYKLMCGVIADHPNLRKAQQELCSHLIWLSKDEDMMLELVGGSAKNMFANNVSAGDEWGLKKSKAVISRIRHMGEPLHISICCEVLCYLTAKSNRNSLLAAFVSWGLWTVMLNAKDVEMPGFFEGLTCKNLTQAFFANLVLTPWAAEFQRLEAEAKHQRTVA